MRTGPPLQAASAPPAPTLARRCAPLRSPLPLWRAWGFSWRAPSRALSSPRVPVGWQVADVTNAVLEGADAVMLSGESANGQYPAESVAMQAAICEHTEGWAFSRGTSVLPEGSAVTAEMEGAPGMEYDHSEGLGAAACLLAQHVGASAIVCYDEMDTGRLARGVARHRPPMPIAAISPSLKICRQLAVSRGVIALPMDVGTDIVGLPDAFDLVAHVCENTPLLEHDDVAVVVLGDRISVETIEHFDDEE
jgi:pyruvate kinase